MTNEIYEQLADALDRLPHGFPRTPSNVELKLLKKIFSPEEASLACQLRGDMEPIDVIAERVRMSVEEASTRLDKMVERGLVRSDKQAGKTWFSLANFSTMGRLENMDHEYAHLVEEYLAGGGGAESMKLQPAYHRVVPAQRSVKPEWILPHDDVWGILLTAKTFRVRDCICRTQQEYIGRRCDFPLKVCLNFSSVEHPPDSDDTGPDKIISQKEALAILNQAEEIGLVHTVSNKIEGIFYICNCCGCCCGILRGINDWGIENSVAHTNYYSVIDPEECRRCGTCIKRCPVHARTLQAGIAVVDRERCIGCGLCVTGCPENAAKLQRKPDAEIVDPPVDSATWEQERLRNRGLIE